MTHASALAVLASKSLAKRRLRPSQAKVRSITQRRGSGLNLTARSPGNIKEQVPTFYGLSLFFYTPPSKMFYALTFLNQVRTELSIVARTLTKRSLAPQL